MKMKIIKITIVQALKHYSTESITLRQLQLIKFDGLRINYFYDRKV